LTDAVITGKIPPLSAGPKGGRRNGPRLFVCLVNGSDHG
jgi:hypothetical protein